jgi:hypothetical protein
MQALWLAHRREFDPQNRIRTLSGTALSEGYPKAIETNESMRIKY